MSFHKYDAVPRLKALSEKTLDLTNPKTLTEERIHKLAASVGDFRLLYATEKVTPEIMEELFDLSLEANVHDKMQAMQNGEVLNFIKGFESENRSVLHTAMRDFFDHPKGAPKAKEATLAALQENEKLKAFIKMNDQKELFTDLAIIGIGGSELGSKALATSLECFYKPHRRVHFISNVDPDNIPSVLEKLPLEKTVVATISKSGGTLETLTNEELVRAYYRKKGVSEKGHFIAVTGKGSPLDNTASYLESFYIWDFIGGRYSVTSMVGGIVLAFCLGYDGYKEVLKGAHWMDQVALHERREKNLPLLSALLGVWNRTFLHYPTVAIIPYCQSMGRFAAHLQQLDMESNGKRIDKLGQDVDYDTGPIIWGEPGTNAQHSFFQMLHQGTTPVPIEFIGFKENQYDFDLEFQGTTSKEKLLSNMIAQSLALATGQRNANPNKYFPGNRPSSILLAKRLDPFTMGALLAYYEHKVAFQGFIWDINSFDQEGVQLGKVLANQVLELFKKHRKGQSLTEKDYLLGEAYLKHLKSL